MSNVITLSQHPRMRARNVGEAVRRVAIRYGYNSSLADRAAELARMDYCLHGHGSMAAVIGRMSRELRLARKIE